MKLNYLFPLVALVISGCTSSFNQMTTDEMNAIGSPKRGYRTKSIGDNSHYIVVKTGKSLAGNYFTARKNWRDLATNLCAGSFEEKHIVEYSVPLDTAPPGAELSNIMANEFREGVAVCKSVNPSP